MSIIQLHKYDEFEIPHRGREKMSVAEDSEWSELYVANVRAKLTNMHPMSIPKLLYPRTPLAYLFVPFENWMHRCTKYCI